MIISKEQALIVFRDGEENKVTINGNWVEIQACSNICVDGWSMVFIESNTLFLELCDFLEVIEELCR